MCKAMIPSWGWVPLPYTQQTFGNVWRQFWFSQLGGGGGGGDTGILRSEARNAAKPPKVHRSAPQQQRLRQPKMSIGLRLRNW